MPRPVSVEVLKARVRRYNSDLEPTGEAFGAALVLIAGAEYGQNIDLLARRTGLSRAFVARCARRLIDNGVWQGGRTVAEWEPRDPASGTFWNDVAVAEGKMCRRPRADGSLEWAPAGFWNKNFHFLDPEADDRLGNRYFDSAPPTPAPESDGPDVIEIPAAAAGEAVAGPGGLRSGNGVSRAADAQGGVERANGAAPPFEKAAPHAEETGSEAPPSDPSEPPSEDAEPDFDLESPVPSLRHVFRDAVWLG